MYSFIQTLRVYFEEGEKKKHAIILKMKLNGTNSNARVIQRKMRKFYDVKMLSFIDMMKLNLNAFLKGNLQVPYGSHTVPHTHTHTTSWTHH